MLAAMVLGSSWFLDKVRMALQEGPAPNSSSPLLTAYNTSAYSVNEQGNKTYTLTTPLLETWSGKPGTRAQTPVLEIFRDNALDWTIQSQSAWMAENQELLRLEEGVTIERKASKTTKPLSMTTRNLEFLPDQNVARTAEAAIVDTPGGHLQAVGITAYLGEERVELLSQVRGTYVPPKR